MSLKYRSHVNYCLLGYEAVKSEDHYRSFGGTYCQRRRGTAQANQEAAGGTILWAARFTNRFWILLFLIFVHIISINCQ
jgi:hypothetical protein